MNQLRQRFLIDRTSTPTGTMIVVADERGCLRAIDWESHETRLQRLLRLHYGDRFDLKTARDPYGVISALHAYMAGEVTALDRLPVATNGTPFQRAVWTVLRGIPPGSTTTYGEIAAQIGSPAAARAVGLANGANPIAIAVPCHRVIGANGSLIGYGGGLARKHWLLVHEGARDEKYENPAPQRSAF